MPFPSMNHDDNQMRFTLHSNPREVVQLQQQLMDLCMDSGFDELSAFQFTSAVIEAVNNCIKHAYAGEGGYPITLEWCHHQDFVTIELRDEGKPLPLRLLESPVLSDTDAESGRGWHIIHEWSDHVGYTRQGEENILTLTRRL